MLIIIKTVPPVCKEIEISQQTYYRWRQKYGDIGSCDLGSKNDTDSGNAWKRKDTEMSNDVLAFLAYLKRHYQKVLPFFVTPEEAIKKSGLDLTDEVNGACRNGW